MKIEINKQVEPRQTIEAFKNKSILLGVCGGIAAYKACEVLRLLQKQGADVTVVMTDSAQEFVTPLTFEALSQKQVYTNLFAGADRGIAHIELVKQHDYMLLVPATAETLAKCAHGRAEDLLSSVFLAFNKPKFIAPAMNTRMWHEQHTQDNLLNLKSSGVHFIEPQSGMLACGDEGLGKLADETFIVSELLRFVAQENSLSGKKIVITAGPTREYIDPVRFISSPSTGTMGFAIAKEAASRGAQVVLISGPVALKKDFNAQIEPVVSAKDMYTAVQDHLDYDYFISSAAVADYYYADMQSEKIKKSEDEMQLNLQRTPDILASVGKQKKSGQKIVAFAAQTENVLENALAKMKQKNADYCVANEVYKQDKGFGSGNSSVHFIAQNTDQGQVHILDQSKQDISKRLWQFLLKE